MDESSVCKKLTSQLGGITKKGRPKLRWLDDVLQGKVTAQWKMIQDRGSWKVIKKAMAHRGL
jgi:hypothetical protein